MNQRVITLEEPFRERVSAIGSCGTGGIMVLSILITYDACIVRDRHQRG